MVMRMISPEYYHSHTTTTTTTSTTKRRRRRTDNNELVEQADFVHCTCCRDKSSWSSNNEHGPRHKKRVRKRDAEDFSDSSRTSSAASRMKGCLVGGGGTGGSGQSTWKATLTNSSFLIVSLFILFLSSALAASQEDFSSPNSPQEVENVSRALQAALSQLSASSTTASVPLSSSSGDPHAPLTTPESTTTTDVYARALRFLEKREKEKSVLRSRNNATSYARPRITRVRGDDRLQTVGKIQDGRTNNATKRMDERVSDQEIEQITDAMVNMTLGSTAGGSSISSTEGEGRSSGGRSIDGFSSIFLKFTKVLDLGRVVREIETSVMTSVSCTACRAGVGLLFHYVNSGRTNQEIAHAAVKLCVNLKMQTPRVCSGIINLYVDEVVEVLKAIVLTSNEICALVVGESCGSQITPAMQWSVNFPPIPKPPFTGYPEPKPDAPKLKVLQISDTHWDPYYEPGSNAECNEPLCCRITSGPKPPRPHLGAGVWGDYRKCDTPRQTMESMFDQISRDHQDVDYIIWTGDIPAHDVWNQTHAGNIEIIRDTVDMLTQFFPHIPIFPALGNHESVPVNSFAPPWVTDSKFNIDWLYSELEKDWSRWLPETTYRTIREGAYYSAMISPGFKLISINTNFCNNKNWWLLVNSTDPAEELKWLIFELQASEFAGEKVHIIGHIPPGHADCMATWSRNYYQIISRYESTIAAQFFGHTHYDELELFYPAEEPFRPSSVAYVGPSVTPYYNLNPGYRIYYVDGDYSASTRTVVDHETWIADISDANRIRATTLTWFKLYSAKEAYGMTNLNPGAWDDLIMSMYKNKRLFNLYYRFYNKNSPVAPDCDEECKQRLLCDARSGKSHAREELCRPRPVHIRTSRGGLAERPQSRFSQIFDTISSALSTLFGYITYPFGFG